MAYRIFTLIFVALVYLPNSSFAVATNEQCKEFSKSRKSAQKEAKKAEKAVRKYERKIERYKRKAEYEAKKKKRIEFDPAISRLNRRIEEAQIKCAAGTIGGIFGIGNIFGGSTGKSCDDALFNLKQQKQYKKLRNEDRMLQIDERINQINANKKLSEFDLANAQSDFDKAQSLFVAADNTYVSQGCGGSIITIPTPTNTTTE